MFQKIFQKANEKDRPHIYQLFKFNLALVLRLIELMSLTILIAGLAWILGDFFIDLLGNFWVGSFLSIVVMLVFIGLCRLAVLAFKSSLDRAVGLDARPLKVRLGQLAKNDLRQLLFIAVFSTAFLAVLLKLPIHFWILVLLVLGFAFLLASHVFLCFKPRVRPLTAEERADIFSPRLLTLCQKINFDTFYLNENFTPVLQVPYLEGLGRRARLVIPQRCLTAFKPNELEFFLFAALMGKVARLPLKYFLMRCFSVALVLPFSAILFSILAPIWAYPVLTKPVLLVIIWAGFWFGLVFSELADLLIKRQLTAQLEAMASLLIKDEQTMVAALNVLDAANLCPDKIPFWITIFNQRYSSTEELKKIQYYAYLAKAPGN